ncbi:hypothetical protein ACOMHN_046271 [Nucella lapillus]
MGDIGRPPLGVTKSRLLGQVKTETLHFQSSSAAVAAVVAASTSATPGGGGGTLIGAATPRPTPFLPGPSATQVVSTTGVVAAATYPDLRRGPSYEDQGVLRASIK